MRKINYYTFNEEDDFKKVNIESANILIHQYGYYFGNVCSNIKDITTLVKSKKDYYNHRIALYYIKNECFVVNYKKNSIDVEVLLDCNGCQIAHYMLKQFTAINKERKKREEKAFDELVRETSN